MTSHLSKLAPLLPTAHLANCKVDRDRSSGERLFLAHFVLNKACLKTEPNWRWEPQEQKRTVRPRCLLGVTQKTIWTQGQNQQRAKEDGSKQVSVHRSQSGKTAISTSQKGKREVPVTVSLSANVMRAASALLHKFSAKNKQFTQIKR